MRLGMWLSGNRSVVEMVWFGRGAWVARSLRAAKADSRTALTKWGSAYARGVRGKSLRASRNRVAAELRLQGARSRPRVDHFESRGMFALGTGLTVAGCHERRWHC
jgi:hypothetical protein